MSGLNLQQAQLANTFTEPPNTIIYVSKNESSQELHRSIRSRNKRQEKRIHREVNLCRRWWDDDVHGSTASKFSSRRRSRSRGPEIETTTSWQPAMKGVASVVSSFVGWWRLEEEKRRGKPRRKPRWRGTTKSSSVSGSPAACSHDCTLLLLLLLGALPPLRALDHRSVLEALVWTAAGTCRRNSPEL